MHDLLISHSQNQLTFVRSSADNYITLSVYSIQSCKVESLDDGFKTSGSYEIVWNTANSSSGVNFFELSAGNNYLTQKLLLIK